MFPEDDLLPISALQHLIFCARRALLVHVEGVWQDNAYTAEGRLLHGRTHDAAARVEVRDDVRIARGLLLRSFELGLTGRADVVEFHRVETNPADLEDHAGAGVVLGGVAGRWRPYIVEYKRGKLRREEGYEVQVCAQAICLEEMLGTQVSSAAIYYGTPRRRLEVALSADLRERTRAAAWRLHELVQAQAVPRPDYGPKCKSCSLMGSCLPQAVSKRRSARRYLSHWIAEAQEEGERHAAAPEHSLRDDPGDIPEPRTGRGRGAG